jgi:hypothetical protein
MDFKKMGKHSLHVCNVCRAICLDGKQEAVVKMKGA